MSRQPARCGTYSGYTTHVHRGEPTCDPCKAAMRAYYRNRRAQRPLAVAPDRAAAHIARLKDNGATNKGLARETGLNYKTFRDIEHGRRRYITTDTERRILDARGDDTRSIDATGTRRRVTALIALGWSQSALAEHLGISDKRVSQLARADRVDRSTAVRVTAVYDLLSMRPGTSKHAHTWATRLGYLPPLAWDDDDIDDPAAWANVTTEDDTPDPVVVERLLAGIPTASTRRERLEAARVACGREGWHDLCKRLGINSARARQISGEVSA